MPADIKSQQKILQTRGRTPPNQTSMLYIRVEEGRKHKGTLDINRIFSDDAKKKVMERIVWHFVYASRIILVFYFKRINKLLPA